MSRPRYCFEFEKISADRFTGAPLAVGAWQENLREVYAIYDRKRGLYDAMCYVPHVEDAERIVDALNRFDVT